MSKMIDGNKLIIVLSDWWYSSFGLEETEESKAIHKVLDAVERYVDHVKSADEWIPCSERLPKENGEYIVSLEDSVYPWARFFNGKWFMLPINAIAREFGEYEVIAWMPLPKPIQRGW